MDYHFTGIDRRDTARTGSADIDNLAAWVERRYLAGWQSLTVYDNAGEICGLIAYREGERHWWVER